MSDWSSDVCSSDLIAAIAIVGGPDVNRLAGLDIRAKRDELAVSIEAVTPRAPSGKDAAGDEAAEVAHHQRREFGRGARSARRRAVGVDIDTLELVDAVFEIIAVGDRPHRPFAVDRADAPVAVLGAAGEEITDRQSTR